jgi:hypothetical protein
MAAEFLDQPVKRETAVGGDRRAAAASEVARLAGKIALDYFERAEVSWKADDSMVTEADVAIQSWLEDEIAAAFPDDGTIAFLAGDPTGHRLSLADIGRASI